MSDVQPDQSPLTIDGDEAAAYRRFRSAKAAAAEAQLELQLTSAELRESFAAMCRVDTRTAGPAKDAP